MGVLLLNLLVVLITLIRSSLAAVGEPAQLKGFYKFLPYEKLTTEKFHAKRLEIANATELKIERFSITAEILIQHLNNTSIEKLILNDITFERLPENRRKLYLPFIKEYRIFVRDVELEESEKNFEMLRPFLIVEKTSWDYYELNVQLGGEVYVNYWLNRNGDYNCQLLYFPPLPASEFKCEVIYITSQSFDRSTLPTNLKKLYLSELDVYETKINGTRNQLTYLHDILTPQLSDFTYYYPNAPNYPIVFDLSFFKRDLQYLCLFYAKIVNTQSFEKEHEIDIAWFVCDHCEFEIMSYTNLRISTKRIVLIDNNYETPSGFQQFISSIRNVESLYVNENQNFSLDWLSATVDSLKYISLANLKYQQPKLSLKFPNVTHLSLVNIKVIQTKKSLQAFPNLEQIVTTDTDPDLLRLTSASEKLTEIALCFPKMGLKGSNTKLESRDFNYIVYERGEDSWTINEKYSSRGIPYKTQFYIHLYILAIFIISSIGLVGNVLIIIVNRRQTPRSSTSYIIMSLALHDSLLLILTQLSLAYFQIRLIMDGTPVTSKWWDERAEGNLKNLFVNPRGFNFLWRNLEITKSYLFRLFNTQSKWIYPLSKAAYFGSVYTTVLLSLERYTAVCFPFRVKDYFSLKYVRTYIISFGILSIILIVIKGLESFYTNEVFGFTTRPCTKIYMWERSTSGKNPLNYRLYRLLFQGIFWNTVMYFIPIPLLLTLNYKIWREIRQSAELRIRSNTNRNTQETITSMLVCVSMVFVICNSISGAIVWYHIQNGADHLADVEIYSCLPLVINSSVNFIIYSLLGKKFREEFVATWNQFSQWIRKWCCICGRRASGQQTAGNPEIMLHQFNG